MNDEIGQALAAPSSAPPRYTAQGRPIKKKNFLQKLLDFILKYWWLILLLVVFAWWLAAAGGWAAFTSFLAKLTLKQWAILLIGGFALAAPGKFGKYIGGTVAAIGGGIISGLFGGGAGGVLGAIAIGAAAWWLFFADDDEEDETAAESGADGNDPIAEGGAHGH